MLCWQIQFAMLNDYLTPQDGHHQVALTAKTLLDAIVRIGVQISERQGLAQARIDEYNRPPS